LEAHEEMRLIVEKCGTKIVLEILLPGDVFPVADALRMGLVNQVLPDDRVAATAREIAEKIADGALLAARWHKKFIYRLLDLRPLTDDEIEDGFDCYDMEDFDIGRKVFLDKKTPLFVGC
jgi:enoyl-CoA hydratase/carnithine racemase